MKKYIFLLSFILFSNLSFGINPPTLVYRCDTRSPAEIKEAGGFYPNDAIGIRDYDLGNHFTGQSVQNYVSGFVSTTYDLRTVVNHCIDLNGLARSAWIYIIVPSENFYSVSDSLQFARNRHPLNSPIRHRINDLIQQYDHMHEYVARDGFSFDRVIRYAELTVDMLDEYYPEEGDSALYTDEFWENHWITSDDFNDEYDGDTASNEIYSYVEEPASSMILGLTQEDIEIPLRFSCESASGHYPGKTMKRSLNKNCPKVKIIKRPYASDVISSLIE